MSIRQWIDAVCREAAGSLVQNGKGKLRAYSTQPHHVAERLESRRLLSVNPVVQSITTTTPTGASSVTYSVTFSEPVTGVAATDFRVVTTGAVTAAGPLVITPVNGSSYSVTIDGIRGNGWVQLNLIDNDSITDSSGNPLGGVGLYNGSFTGQTCDILQTLPRVLSINRATSTGSGTFSFTVSFSETVTGVAPSDFQLVTGGNVFASAPVSVMGSGSVYTVTAQGVSGVGTLGLNLIDNGAIRDAAGNPLTDPAADLAFAPQQTYAVGEDPRTATVADVNNDGIPDIVAVDFGFDSRIAVLLGNGDGTFKPAITTVAPSSPTLVAAGDFNGDGNLDLIIRGNGAGTLDMMLGNGNGTFQTAQTITSSPSLSVPAPDVNGDGIPDLVQYRYGYSSVGVSLGNGNGTFGPQQTFAVGSQPLGAMAADFNGDGRTDLVSNNTFDGDVSVLLNAGNGNFKGQVFVVGTLPVSDKINLGPGVNQITLVSDPDGTDIDWTAGASAGQLPINDPAGLTINGNAANDQIALNFANSPLNPLPTVTHLNGTFTTSGLGGLAGDTLDILGTVYISYPGRLHDPVSLIQSALRQGFNSGGWNGAAGPNGAITSTSAANDPLHQTAVGWADSADGLIAVQPANTIELKYTYYGDTYLRHIDNIADLLRVQQHLNQTTGGTWDTGDFNFDGAINSLDVALLNRAYNSGNFVQSIKANIAAGPQPSNSVVYTVVFNESVTGVNAADFQVAISGNVTTLTPVVSPVSASVYSVAINGIHGYGTVRLDLVDNDSIIDSAGNPLGGPGKSNGSFQGQTVPVPLAGPQLLSINRATTGPGSVNYVVMFNEPVTGVVAGDFQLSTGGSVTVSQPLAISGSGSSYTVTISGISGVGTLQLNLVDQGTIRDASGKPLANSGPTNFQSQMTLAITGAPVDVVTGDLNGDGFTDLVVGSDANSGLVTVLLGNGDGTFAPAASYAFPGDAVESIALADVNGDGTPDLLVTLFNFEPVEVVVMLGNGNGTFKPMQPVLYSGPFGPARNESLATGDLNGDELADVVLVGGQDGGNAYDALSNGDGTFQTQRDFTIYGGYPVALADMNGDGKSDLVLPGTVLLGNGDGTFLPPPTNVGTGYGSHLAVADVNGDGVPDMIVTYQQSGTAAVLLGNGNGTFQLSQNLSVGNSPAWVTANDVNGDGNVDLVVADGGSNVVSVLLGNGNGTFQYRQTYAAGSAPSSLAVAEFNGDGRPDLVVANYGSDTISVLPGGPTVFSGQVFGIGFVSGLDTITGTPASDQIALTQDPDGAHIDWTMANSAGQLAINDPNGLTINGNGGNDVITLDYVNGNPLPDALHLDGTFTINGLQGIDPFAGKTLDIGPSTVYLTYANPTVDPLPAIQRELSRGFNDLSWTGTATPSAGVITSSSAMNDMLRTTGVGYADSADGFVYGQPPDTIELKYTLYGDTGLTGSVGYPQYARVNQHLGQVAGASWDTGDFNYDGVIDDEDLLLLDKNWIGATVLSINRLTAGQFTNASSVSYTVTFSAAVSGVAAADFRAVTSGALTVGEPPVVSAISSSVYTVTLNGIHGNGTVELDLIDNDSIHDAANAPLGGVGPANGSFQGQNYIITQPFPFVVSIDRTTPGPISSASSVSFAVTFSEPVNGVDASDFSLITTGSIQAAVPLIVNGAGASYTVTVNGISGVGSLGLELVDNGTIHDDAGNPLRNPGGKLSFQNQMTFAVGPYPEYLTTADLNNDGIPDLIVSNVNAQNIGVLLGNGNGTFQPQQTYAAAYESYPVVCDLNNDGIPDIAFVNDSYSGGVSVLLGNGDGTFRPQQTFAVGADPVSLAVGDLNHDGRADLVTANYGSASLSILFGIGDGTFQKQVPIVVGTDPNRVAVSDVNGDGNLDIVVTDSNGVNVLLGNGNGTFQPEKNVSRFGGSFLAVADLNSDGIPDLVTASAVMLGNGNGTFRPPISYGTGFNFSANWGTVADVNADGKPDLIITNGFSGQITEVFLGNGNGTFQAPQTLVAGGYSIAASDFNGDGKPDLAVGFGYSSVDVILGNQVGTFAGQTYSIVPTLDTVTGTAGVDQLTLAQDPDGMHIDWILAGTTAQLAVNDPNGLTINGNGGNDVITLDYTHGNPLPIILHLNGTFTINGFQGTNLLSGTMLDIGRSTVFISYSSSDPIAAIQSYLHNGYNNGAWNGTPGAGSGVITSLAARANANHNTAIGYADFADGHGVDAIPNTIELKYTLIGDANLDTNVNSADLQILLFGLNRPGSWDQGDFNYDGQVNSADLQVLLFTLNTTLATQATPMAIAETPTTSTTTAPSPISNSSSSKVPPVHPTAPPAPATPHAHHAKASSRKRR